MMSDANARRLKAGVTRQGSIAPTRAESMRGYDGATPGGNCAPSFSSRFDAAWISPRSVPARITIDPAPPPSRETSKLSPSSAIGAACAEAVESPRSILISARGIDASGDDPTREASIAASPLDRSPAASAASCPPAPLKRTRGQEATPALLTFYRTPDGFDPSFFRGFRNDNMSATLSKRGRIAIETIDRSDPHNAESK